MSSPNAGWQLTVLGAASLRGPDGQLVRIDARGLALLAYLALEGRQPRALLAALLWPGTEGAAARNNLVHLLRRLRTATAEDLVQADAQHLSLAPTVQVDALSVNAMAVGHPPAPFLSEHDFDGSQDLEDWVFSQREALLSRWMASAWQQLARAEAHGRVEEALQVVQVLLDADPLAEAAHRALMRLQYARADRPAALQAYQRFKALLRDEVGVEPEAETVQLARAIDAGTLPVAAQAGSIPLSVLRPPTLVGREAEWARMEQAWASGLGIMVIGDPGSGKSRLAVDFLRSKSTHQLLLFEGRPGDQAAPYTTHARTYKQVLDAYPDLALPGWVKGELSRIIPELRGPGDPVPLPLSSEGDKLRFYEAKVEMIRLVAERGPVILASDDLQFMDEASIEAGGFVFSRFFGDAQTNLRTLFCFRTGALSGLAAAVAQQMMDAGLAVPIRLGPLDGAAVGALLSDIEVPGEDDLAGPLWHHTQGNPQFVLEVIKGMYETRTFSVPSDHTDRDGDVAGQIAERLARLSAPALRAARAAAVLQGGFTLELVAEVLHIGLLDIASAWEELERAQVTRGERFAHDLLGEAVLAQLPPTTARLLHRSAAQVLTADRIGERLGVGAQAARVARHWQASGEPLRAAPWLVKAAEAAEATLRPEEAAGFYREAAALFDAAGQAAEAEAARTAAQHVQVRTAG